MDALRDYWHPVALMEEVGDRPTAVNLLGERIVLYRAGAKVVARRGTRTQGPNRRPSQARAACRVEVRRGRCVCPYTVAPARAVHPAEGARDRLSRRGALRCRVGVPWHASGTRPAFPEAEAAGYRTFWTRHHVRATAARVIENVMDFAHFPWVHPGILGDRSKPMYESTPARSEGYEIHYTVDDVQTNAVRTYRNFSLDQPDSTFEQQDTDVIAQDRWMVEAQRPEELPLDLSAELHLRGTDAAAVEYRRALARLGLG